MRLRNATTILLLLALAAPCFGWGRDGHRIAGAIAWHYLTDKSKAAIQDLLGQQTLADASNWADEIRDQQKYDWAKALHYINAPRDAQTIDLARDCKNGECVVGAIERFSTVLRDANAPRADRIEALKFLIHFVQDVHQPLHVSYADDRGGNNVKVRWGGHETNLHSLWDTGIIEHKLGMGDWIALAYRIQEDIRESKLKSWQEGSQDPSEWANESLALTRRIYLDLPNDLKLSSAYAELNFRIVEDRLAAAGVRLAGLLNAIFENASTPATPAASPTTSSPTTTGAASFVQMVEGESCGNADGKFVYLANHHSTDSIRVKVRKSWTANGKAMSSEQTYVIRPGEQAKKQLGCRSTKIAGGEVRTFEWSVVEAEFIKP